MVTLSPASIQPKMSTAQDTLQRKTGDASVISGGHGVATAQEGEGVGTINIWVDPREHAPGTKNQTMFK